MERSELVAAYEAAGSVSALARALDISLMQARYRLMRAEIPIKRSGWKSPGSGSRLSGADHPNWKGPESLPPDLREAYAAAGSVSELARRLGVTDITAKSWLKRAGIATARSGFKSPRTVPSKRGPEHHNWKGGTYVHEEGYVMQYAPDHPAAPSGKGYVMQHRLVMEAQLGRLLGPHEIVHHKNEDKQDNRLDNLELTTRTPHMRHHKSSASRDTNGRFS